jgi:RND family efflux transporter MFP subunit
VTIRTLISAGALAGLSLTLAACGGGEKTETAPQRQTVTAATAGQTNLHRTVNASGTVEAWEMVPVGAETGGLTAVALYVDEGAWVRQGQPLVQMNDVLLRAQLRQQQAQVQTAEANLARDDAALARSQELKQKGFLSQASLDTALANQRSSAANLSAARAALSETQTRVNQATIRAPVAGQISSRSVTKGQIIQAGTELFKIVRDGRLELNAQVPETEMPLVRAGQSATIVADQNGEAEPRSIGGNVRIVTPQVDAQTRLGLARVAISSGSGLRPGNFARATIDVGQQASLTIPSAAIVYREGRAGVYVIGENEAVRFVPVQTGARSGDLIVVTQGLNAGQRVVVSGAGFLGDGDLVTVSTGAAATAAQPKR